MPKLQVEIWSDVVCPFCYIGKRQLESALEDWPQRDQVEVIWRSFQLAPDTKTDPTRNSVENLAQKKGWTLEQTWQAVASVTERAKAVGLALHYETTKVANTFDAHRVGHLAAAHGRGDAMAERLFQAYFVDGLNLGDPETLAALGAQAGLPPDEVRALLDSDRYAADVQRDIEDAARFGIHAVPCFVLDRKYAVSGAQESDVLRQALAQALQARSA